MTFEFGPNIPPGSAAHADLSAILEGSYELGAKMPEDPKLIVDVGANVGAFTHWARRRFPNATIVALEPNPEAFEILKRNLAGQERVILLPFAASNERAERRLWRGTVTLGESSFHDIGQQSREYADVVAIRLDEILPFAPDVLKVDTEGHERAVIAGCTQWPNGMANVKYVAMEIHRREDEALLLEELVGRQGLRVVARELESECEDRIVVRLAR